MSSLRDRFWTMYRNLSLVKDIYAFLTLMTGGITVTLALFIGQVADWWGHQSAISQVWIILTCFFVLFVLLNHGTRGFLGRHWLIRRLTELADYGTDHLLNKPVQHPGEVYSLWAEYGVWEHDLINEMEQYSCNDSDIALVRKFDTFTSRGLTGITPEHGQLKELVAEKVARVREIVRRLENQ